MFVLNIIIFTQQISFLSWNNIYIYLILKELFRTRVNDLNFSYPIPFSKKPKHWSNLNLNLYSVKCVSPPKSLRNACLVGELLCSYRCRRVRSTWLIADYQNNHNQTACVFRAKCGSVLNNSLLSLHLHACEVNCKSFAVRRALCGWRFAPPRCKSHHRAMLQLHSTCSWCKSGVFSPRIEGSCKNGKELCLR